MMRTILAAGAIALAMAGTACNVSDCISGSGVVTTQQRSVPTFRSVTLNGSMHLVVTQDTVQSLRLEGEENILPLLTTTVTDGRLTIGTDRCYSTSSEITVYAGMTAIDGLRISGSGKISSTTPLSGDRLDLEIEGSGDISLSLTMAHLTSSIDGSGTIGVTGRAPRQTIAISGSGRVDAAGLSSDTCAVSINGSGSALVDAAKLLDVDINGSGMVYYKGTPSITSTITGSGKVIRL